MCLTESPNKLCFYPHLTKDRLRQREVKYLLRPHQRWWEVELDLNPGTLVPEPWLILCFSCKQKRNAQSLAHWRLETCRLSKTGELRGSGRGATCVEPSAGPFRPCPMVIWGEVVTKMSEGWMWDQYPKDWEKREKLLMDRTDRGGWRVGSWNVVPEPSTDTGPLRQPTRCWDGHQSAPVLGTGCHVHTEQPGSHKPVKDGSCEF